MSIQRVVKTYDVSQITLRDRIKDCTSKVKERKTQYNLTLTEEETFVRYILDLDLREFPSRINDVRDMIDLLYKTRYVKPVNK